MQRRQLGASCDGTVLADLGLLAADQPTGDLPATLLGMVEWTLAAAVRDTACRGGVAGSPRSAVRTARIALELLECEGLNK